MNDDAVTAAVVGLILRGTLARAAGDFLLLFTGGLAAGGFAGAVAGLVRDWRRRRSSRGSTTYLYDRPGGRAAAETMGFYGSLVGGAIGLVVAILDALIGQKDERRDAHPDTGDRVRRRARHGARRVGQHGGVARRRADRVVPCRCGDSRSSGRTGRGQASAPAARPHPAPLTLRAARAQSRRRCSLSSAAYGSILASVHGILKNGYVRTPWKTQPASITQFERPARSSPTTRAMTAEG